MKDYGSKLPKELARAGSAEPEGIRKEASLGAFFLFACSMICRLNTNPIEVKLSFPYLFQVRELALPSKGRS